MAAQLANASSSNARPINYWLATKSRRCTNSPASMLRFLPPLTVLVLALMATPALGAPSASEIAVARQLFEQGKLLQDRGEWSRAITQYRKALDIKDTPGLRYRVGYCEEQLGHLVEAGVEYERARELLEAGVRADDVAELLPQTIASLRQRTPHLVLVLADPPPNMTVRVDGTLLAHATIGRHLPLNPGDHAVTVSAPGFLPITRTVALREGERQRLRVSLTPAPHQDTPHHPGATDSTSDEGSDMSRVLVLIGEGALLTAGIGMGIIATMEKNQAEDDIHALNAQISKDAGESAGTCAEPTSRIQSHCQRLANAVDEYAFAEDLATIGFVAAGVSAAALVATYLAWPEHKASVRAVLLPEGGSLAISGSF